MYINYRTYNNESYSKESTNAVWNHFLCLDPCNNIIIEKMNK